jgi:hypothetical protein
LRLFLTKPFQRFARKEGIRETDLCDAVARAERGLVDADLGGGVIKQRIARPGEGRSGGFRTIILFRAQERAFFVYGFSKSSRDNITNDDLRAYREFAAWILVYETGLLEEAVKREIWREVKCDE